MKRSTRTLKFSVDGNELVITERIERLAYVPLGYTNRQWDTNRVGLTREELVKALEFIDRKKDAIK